jgi:hypothetical protein
MDPVPVWWVLYAVWWDTLSLSHVVSRHCVTTEARRSNLHLSVRYLWWTKCQWARFSEYTESPLSVYRVSSVSIQSLLCQYTQSPLSVYSLLCQYTESPLSVYTVSSVSIHSLLCHYTVSSVIIQSPLSLYSLLCQYTESPLSVYTVSSVSIQSLLCQYTESPLSVYTFSSVSIQSLLCQYTESSLSVTLHHCSILIHSHLFLYEPTPYRGMWLVANNMLLLPSACRQPINNKTLNSILKFWLLPGITRWQY